MNINEITIDGVKFKEYAIEGVIQVPENVSEEVLVRKFLDFMETNGFYFGGAIKDIKDNDKSEEDGNGN